MHRMFRLLTSIGLALMLATTLVSVGSAHEHREVADGQFELTVGS